MSMQPMIETLHTRNVWDERSTIRNRPRRILQHHEDMAYFPKQEQPLCLHHLVRALGPAAESFILTQSSYRFMASVFEHETKVVTDVVQGLAYGALPIPEATKQDLLSVVIDELYHGYVARDFVRQVVEATAIEPLPFAKASNFGRALARSAAHVPEPMRGVFAAVVVCIVENVITQDLVGIPDDPNVNRLFYEVNRDHLADEGRHAGIFANLVTHVWAGLTKGERADIQAAIPLFVGEWLSRDLAIADDALILRSLHMSESDISEVLHETHPALDLSSLGSFHPTVRHIEQWLRRVKVWDGPEAIGDTVVAIATADPVMPIEFLAHPRNNGSHGSFNFLQIQYVKDFSAPEVAVLFATYLCHVLQKASLTVDVERDGIRLVGAHCFRVAPPGTAVGDLPKNWHDKPEGSADGDECRIPLEIRLTPDTKPPASPSTIRATIDGSCTSLEVTYHSDAYDDQRIKALLRDFSNYLNTASIAPSAAISSLPLVSPDAVYSGGENPGAEAPRATILDALARHAADHPDRVALCSHDRWFTYEALERRISALSHALAGCGLKQGSCVGILVRSRLDFVSSLLGVMKAGFLAVPLPVESSSEHLAELIDQSTVELVLCCPEQREALDAASSRRPTLQTWLCEEALFKGEELKHSLATPGSAACVLFTSGTSGKPKGVVLYHEELVRFAAGAKEAFPLLPTDVILQFSNLSFDASLAEIVNAIGAGAALALPTEDVMDSEARFFDECRALRVTVLNLPAAFWGQLARGADDLPETIRTILVYGEALSQDSLKAWYRRRRDAVLINTYGPTEATIGASYCRLDLFERLRHEHQLIGRPFRGRKIYVLDAFRRPLPVGAVGEIALGGAGTHAFYLSDARLQCVTGDHDQLGPLYATGDLGRWLPCGDSGENVLVFHGRRDRQVKIRGRRVELSAIESVLSAHPAVSDALSLVRHRDNASSLDAFVLKRPGCDLTEREIRRYLEGKLPRHSWPARLHVLDAWPRTPRGKIDQAQLQNLPDAGPSPGSEGDASSRALSDIWRQLLGVTAINADSHFFELGGHSLLAMSLVAKVNEHWSVSLTLRNVFENPRFGELCRLLKSALERRREADARPCPQRPTAIGQVSFGQQAMLVSDRLNAGKTPQHNVAFEIHLHGPLNEIALSAALAFVVDRQAALRCVFAWDQGQARQKLVDLPVILEKASVDQAAYRRFVEEDAKRAHSPLTNPPMRVRLFQIIDRPATSILHFNLHHVIHDGLSIGILMQELLAAYEAFDRGQRPALPDLTESYLDFAAESRDRLTSGCDESLEFWRRYLQGSPPLALTRRRERRGNAVDGASHEVTIDALALARLRQRCRSRNLSLSAAVLTAAFYAFRPRTRQADYTVASVVSLRDKAAHEHLVGMFVQMVLLRSHLSPQASVGDDIASVQQAILEMLPHRHVPLPILIEELNLPRDPHDHKIFDVMVNYHALWGVFEPKTVGSLRAELRFIDHHAADAGLSIDFYDRDEQTLTVRLGYCRNLYDSADIESLGQDVRRLIESFADCGWQTALEEPDLPTTRREGFGAAAAAIELSAE